MIFLIVFTAVLLFTILRLFIWNIGEDTGYDPSETTTEFDVELMDYLQPLDPEMRSDWEDDGVTTVLALGKRSAFRRPKQRRALCPDGKSDRFCHL